MHNQWDYRYSSPEYIYGKEPNFFFKEFIDRYPSGKILLPAEGEGRNAVYAAKKGWQVDAFDTSREGMAKALRLASQHGVTINYFIHDIYKKSDLKDDYDAIALIFAHLHSSERRPVHRYLAGKLKKGGYLILNAFAREQLQLNTGGPKDIEMLYSLNEIKEDFNMLDILIAEHKRINLDEGRFHSGMSENILILAKKI